jgi:Zn-dependent metalloprotease
MKYSAIILLTALFVFNGIEAADKDQEPPNDSGETIRPPNRHGIDDVTRERLSNIAYEYLEANKTKYGIKNPREELGDVFIILNRRGYPVLTLDQKYKDVTVYGGSISMVFDKNDTVLYCLNHMKPEVIIDVKPVISQDEAVKTAVDDFRSICEGVNDRVPELFIFKPNDKVDAYMAWELIIKCQDEIIGWWYRINAKTGEIIQKNRDIVH